jgi:hypothetical protein
MNEDTRLLIAAFNIAFLPVAARITLDNILTHLASIYWRYNAAIAFEALACYEFPRGISL